MKYIGDLLRISAFVMIIYLPIVFLTSIGDFKRLEENINEERLTRLNIVRENIAKYLEQDRVLDACQRLAAEKDSLNLATYVLHSPEGDCVFPSNMILPPVQRLGEVTPLSANGQEMVFIRDKTRDAEWAISVSTKKLSYLGLLSTGQASVLLHALFLNLLQVIYVIFAFICCAVLILAKTIQIQHRKNGKNPVWLKIVNGAFGWLQMHDMKIVQSATAALIKKNETLVKDQDLLETSLEYSILNEIRTNNHMIPYTFRGTVAKVDINGFSKAISSGHSSVTQDLTKLLEDFGCELLQRYKGLFEKTVGDEIVVVFKDENSAMRAAAFSRDLMHEFSLLEFDFSTEKRRFTLKSSISSSQLTFSKRAPGYGFLGDALTYTTRLLDVVNIKDRNILSCMKTQATEIEALVMLPNELKTFEFKNMAASEGYLIDRFLTIQEAYEGQNHLLRFFRSNDALVYMLEKLMQEKDSEKLDLIFTCFAEFEVRVCNNQIIDTWIKAMKAFEVRVKEDPTLAHSFSRLIIQGARLIPNSQWTARCTETIISISRHIEGRINASFVDVLIEKDLNQIALEHQESFLIGDDHSFRTRGNLLISQAIHQLSNSIFDKLIKMVTSENTSEIGTGIYAACRVIIHYQTINPAELETFISYKKLLKILNDLVSKKEKLISARLLKLIDQMNSYYEIPYKEAKR